jgi:DNA repair photolyase
LKLYKSPINVPKTGHELITCHYPLRIDTYSSCYHDCEYCYAKSMLVDRNLWNPKDIRVADIDEIKNKISFYRSVETKGIVAAAIRNRIPARLGGLTDCFQPIEKHKDVTLRLIKYLNSIDYPYLIVTKGDLVGDSTYLNELRKDLAYVQITVTTTDAKIAKQLEPNAPSIARRISVLQRLKEAGIYCAGRISPVIPGITEDNCLELIELLQEIKIPHILLEFFRGSRQMIRRVEEATNKEIPCLQKRGIYYRVPLKEKWAFYYEVAKKIEGNSTLFTVCSDGDPVPFFLHSTNNCCGADGIRRLIPDTKFNMGNEKVASNIYRELVRKNVISIEDLDLYFSLAEEEFRKAWNSGSLEHYLPNCKWNEETNTYSIVQAKQE